ncbi:crossover junction endonuclease EME1 [Rhincodon typus]|uniref:crossover junction endonuclease EME1 n=1 Tax=Rhincodon typus TaxID=259920 RepID=UPI0009A449BB|nr:crossover junction endonuclease EME1 [Rhincodon typus]XP_020385314.1 crossover junction endonuclease EME1 [Rhincodon typus]
MMEEETSDTDLNNDSLELPVFSFTGLRSHTACDGAFGFKHRTPEHSNSVVIEGSDSENYDPPLAKTSCSQTNLRHSVKRLPNEVVTIASSESDGDEDLVIPLAERLKRKLTKNQNVEKFDYSVSKSSQENSKPNSLLKASIPSTCQINRDDSEIKETEVARHSKGQDAEPVFVRRKAFHSHSTWDISDSDEGDEACKWQTTTSHIPDLNSAQLHGRNACSSTKAASNSFQPHTKLKRNVVEIENARSEALRKQQEREQRKAEKENIQRQKEEERVMRKELANIEKMFRPGECLKHMLVSIDPGLLQVDGGGQLLSTLQTMEVKCVIENQTIPHSMTWKRRQACIAGQLMNEKTDWVEELHVLIYIPLEEFVSMVYNSKQEVQGASTEGHTTLQSFAHDILQKSASRIPCFVVVELERYFRPQKKQRSQKKHQHTVPNEEQDKQRKAKGCDHHLPLISRADVELALVHLQLSVGTQFQLLETWKEFADYISMFTKAVAEAPFKKARENNGLSVYLANDGSRGVKVDCSVNGLLCVWKKQIQQLNRVSSEMANAIVSVYQSPWSLKQAYRMCSSEREKENLLANIPVRRGEGTTSTTRRIGPELSKRIYLLMTSMESETFLE